MNSLKKGAGIKCPGRKMLAILSPEHAPMGLNFFSKNEMNDIAVKGDSQFILCGSPFFVGVL